MYQGWLAIPLSHQAVGGEEIGESIKRSDLKKPWVQN